MRYAWHDFVECVLVNDADLPMGPWKKNTTVVSTGVTAPGVAPELLAPDIPIQSPPMGFNRSFNPLLFINPKYIFLP